MLPIQTHAPRDENDEPLAEFCTLLDAVRLITLVPRNLGVSSSDTYYSADSSSFRSCYLHMLVHFPLGEVCRLTK